MYTDLTLIDQYIYIKTIIHIINYVYGFEK